MHRVFSMAGRELYKQNCLKVATPLDGMSALAPFGNRRLLVDWRVSVNGQRHQVATAGCREGRWHGKAGKSLQCPRQPMLAPDRSPRGFRCRVRC